MVQRYVVSQYDLDFLSRAPERPQHKIRLCFFFGCFIPGIEEVPIKTLIKLNRVAATVYEIHVIFESVEQRTDTSRKHIHVMYTPLYPTFI